MEMAIDHSLRTYSGGLGFLAGSHIKSAGQLDLPMVGVCPLWTYGYGDQQFGEDGQVEIVYKERRYDFLTDIKVEVDVTIYGETVKVRSYRLEPETFGTVPIYFLTTDFEGAPEHHRAYTRKLYDSDQRTRIAQEIILGVGGYRVLKVANVQVDVVHMNEGHAIPAAFEMLRETGGDLGPVRHRLVFTTHTPVAAGNETHNAHLLAEAGFFVDTPLERAIQLGGEEFSLTVASLRMARIANGVSQLHGQVANNMWQWVTDRCPIIAITNAVNVPYWQDPRITDLVHGPNAQDPKAMQALKRSMRQELIDYVNKQTGKNFDPNVLTVVWARRFTDYKRSWLIMSDLERLKKLLDGNKIQLIFAGKFHPLDVAGRNSFNEIIKHSKNLERVAILSNPGYELELSAILKRGADIWLNTPLRPMEASGTSGMGANLNGTIHVSTLDGWAVEGTYHGLNGFIINEKGSEEYLPVEERHKQDYESMMSIFENEIIPMFYNDPDRWSQLMFRAIQTAESYFHSHRMAIEYFVRLYKPVHL
jgi:starch phosphorylase